MPERHGRPDVGMRDINARFLHPSRTPPAAPRAGLGPLSPRFHPHDPRRATLIEGVEKRRGGGSEGEKPDLEYLLCLLGFGGERRGEEPRTRANEERAAADH